MSENLKANERTLSSLTALARAERVPRGVAAESHVICSAHEALLACDAARIGELATHYQTLGLTAGATALEIRDAYRRLILLAHPDRAGVASRADDASRLNLAYETLADSARRAAYDETLRRQARESRRGQRSAADWSTDRDKDSRNVRVLDLSAFEEPADDASPFTRACRCGATLTVTTAELEMADGEVSLACGGCSERVIVLYETVDEPAAAAS